MIILLFYVTNMLSEEIPFKTHIQNTKNEIGFIDIIYLPLESKCISDLLEQRELQEKGAQRVTSLIKYDFFPENYRKITDKKYFSTYHHDKLQDVICKFFELNGFTTYKEKFISKYHQNMKLKGHSDIIVRGKSGINILVEIKNYLEYKINYNDFIYFMNQVLLYSYLLNIPIAYLFINNPPLYKGVKVFKININESNKEYIKYILNTAKYIKETKETFKYK